MRRIGRFWARGFLRLALAGALWGPTEMRGAQLEPARAAGARTSLDSLTEEAARLTTRYADRDVAISDGYRRLGADFPGMGEHWLHAGPLVMGQIDAARPTLLMYADFGGEARLVGLGFVLTTHRDAGVLGVPGWPHAWHEHSGPFADESGVRVGASKGTERGTRVWVLHAWTGLENPGGTYAPDNWLLPFARLGLSTPAEVDADAGRALALHVQGDRYLLGVLTDAGLRNGENEAQVDAAVAAARARVAAIVVRARAAEPPQDDITRELRAVWRWLATELREMLGEAAEGYLAEPHPAHQTGASPAG